MIKATHQPSLYALFTSHQFLFTRTNLPKAIFVGSCAPSQIVLDNFSIKGNPSLSDHARLEIVQPGVKLCSLAYSGGPREMSEWLGTLELKRNRSKSSYYGVIPAGKRWQARLYKPAKQKWDPIGTYDSPREAAEAAAKERKRLDDGLPVYSPQFKRFRSSGGTRFAQRPPVRSSQLTSLCLPPGYVARPVACELMDEGGADENAVADMLGPNNLPDLGPPTAAGAAQPVATLAEARPRGARHNAASLQVPPPEMSPAPQWQWNAL